MIPLLGSVYKFKEHYNFTTVRYLINGVYSNTIYLTVIVLKYSALPSGVDSMDYGEESYAPESDEVSVCCYIARLLLLFW